MKTFTLSDNEKISLRAFHEELPYEKFQTFMNVFVDRLYDVYKLNPRKYLSIQVFPESRFGVVTLEDRDRVIVAKKISKSDQA